MDRRFTASRPKTPRSDVILGIAKLRAPHHPWHQHGVADEPLEVVADVAGVGAAVEEDAQLHVAFHGGLGEVGAAKQQHVSIRDHALDVQVDDGLAVAGLAWPGVDVAEAFGVAGEVLHGVFGHVAHFAEIVEDQGQAHAAIQGCQQGGLQDLDAMHRVADDEQVFLCALNDFHHGLLGEARGGFAALGP